MQPIVVEKHRGMLRLRAGHRRTAAARMAGLTRVPAVIHEDALDDDEWLIASVQENVHRQQINQVERVRTVRALLDLGCSKDGIAEAFGVAPETVSKWLTGAREKKPSGVKLGVGTLRRLTAEWRERGCDADTILAELEELLPPLTPHTERAVKGNEARDRTVKSRSEAKVEDVERLLAAGESLHAIANSLDSTIDGMARFLYRQERPDLARQFAALAQRERTAVIPDDTEQRHARLRAINAQIMRERQSGQVAS